MNKDIVIVDYFDKIKTTEITDAGREVINKLNLHVINVRKYRGRIERRKKIIKQILNI